MITSRIALALGCLVVSGQVAFAESPREFADRFYHLWRHWEIRGVPEPKESRLVAPYMSGELLKLFAEVDRQTAEDARLHPFDPKHPEKSLKGIWSKEGDSLADRAEGFTTFAIGRVTRVHGRIAVEVHLEYITMGKVYPWTDILVLDRAADRWVVADVVFAGGGSMVGNLKKELAENDAYFRSVGVRSATTK